MTRRFGFAIVGSGLVLVLGLARCSLIGTDGLSGGAADDGGQLQDAPADTVVDAGVDAGANVDAGPWCERQSPAPQFCDDFDREPPLLGWAPPNVRLDAGATVAASALATSPPNVLLVTTGPIATSYTEAYLSHTFAGKPIETHTALDVRIEELDPAGADAILAGIWHCDCGGTNPYALTLRMKTTRLEILEQIPAKDGGATTTQTFVLSDQPQIRRWMRVAIDINYGGTGGSTLAVSIDGKSLLEPKPTIHAAEFVSAPTLTVGVRYLGGPSAAWKVLYDNVTFNYR